jgi:hypothetical protein
VTFQTTIEAIETHAQTVGAAMTPAMTDVCIGLPFPRGRCVRVYWDGEADPPRMPMRNSLNSELVGDRVTVRGFWPVASADEAAHKARVLEMHALAHGIRDAIDGDTTLNGEIDTVVVGDSVPDAIQFGGTWYAVLDIPLTLGHREVEMTR